MPDTPEARAARQRAELGLGKDGLERHLAPHGLRSCVEAAPRLIDRRVLIISGEQDTVAPPESIAPLAHALPDACWISVPNAGHSTIPAEWLVNAVASWLQGEAVARPLPDAVMREREDERKRVVVEATDEG